MRFGRGSAGWLPAVRGGSGGWLGWGWSAATRWAPTSSSLGTMPPGCSASSCWGTTLKTGLGTVCDGGKGGSLLKKFVVWRHHDIFIIICLCKIIQLVKTNFIWSWSILEAGSEKNEVKKKRIIPKYPGDPGVWVLSPVEALYIDPYKIIEWQPKHFVIALLTD